MRIIDIKGCKTCNKVLIFKERNDNGEDYAKIVAWHKTENGEMYQEDTFDGGGAHNDVLIKAFIDNFSEFSANEFANDFNL